MTDSSNPSAVPPNDLSAQEAHGMVDQYLDGLLSPAQEAAFQNAVSKYTSLQTELDLQKKVNASLSRVAQPPSNERFVSMLDESQQDLQAPLSFPTAARTHRRAILGTIAALLMAAVGLALIWDALPNTQSQSDQYPPKAWQSLTATYNETISHGFKPAWICADDQEFTETFESRYGQGLLMAALPDNMQALGLAYSNTISPETLQLLAEVDGAPLMVFIDRSSQLAMTPPETLEVEEPLHLHRRSINDLVLYELSPFESPLLLDSFYNPVEARDP